MAFLHTCSFQENVYKKKKTVYSFHFSCLKKWEEQWTNKDKTSNTWTVTPSKGCRHASNAFCNQCSLSRHPPKLSFCCYDNTWWMQLKMGLVAWGMGLLIGLFFEGIIHHGGESVPQEKLQWEHGSWSKLSASRKSDRFLALGHGMVPNSLRSQVFPAQLVLSGHTLTDTPRCLSPWWF